MSERIVRADPGMQITVTSPDGREAVWEVQPSCGTNGAGQWYCVTHNEPFRHNWDKDTHCERGKHVLAWRCFDCGEFEVP